MDIRHHARGERASKEGFNIVHVRLVYRVPRRTVAYVLDSYMYFRVFCGVWLAGCLVGWTAGLYVNFTKGLGDTHVSSTANNRVEDAYGIGKSCRTRLFALGQWCTAYRETNHLCSICKQY